MPVDLTPEQQTRLLETQNRNFRETCARQEKEAALLSHANQLQSWITNQVAKALIAKHGPTLLTWEVAKLDPDTREMFAPALQSMPEAASPKYLALHVTRDGLLLHFTDDAPPAAQ